MANPLIVDLSHWNTVTSFDDMKDGGTIGVIHKATQGISYVDPEYEERRQGAKFAGLVWSSYHFLEHGEIPRQIDHYLNTAKPQPGDRICLDFEENPSSQPMLADLIEAVSYLLNNHPEFEITVYGGGYLKDLLGDHYNPTLEKTSLWLAQYSDAADITWPKNVWPIVSLWQYSQNETCSGVTGPVDGNKFNGSDENAAKWLAGSHDTDDDGDRDIPDRDRNAIVIRISAPEGVEVRLILNGEDMI